MWQPKKDSNPHKQSQSLSCYLYTIRLNACRSLRLYYYSASAAGCQVFFSEQQDFLWRHLTDGAAQLLEGSLFDTGDIAARQVHTAGDLVLRQ